MSSLLDMTDLPMTNILEKCDFKSVLTLRKVCHSLRNFIDDSCFKTDLDDIRITIGPTGYSVSCKSHNASWTDASSSKDWSSNDLKIILKMAQNSKLSYFNVNTNPDNAEGLDDLEDILKNQTRPLQTEHFVMEGSEILKVLPYIDSKTLKEISISPEHYGTDDQNLDGIEQLLELEQFKNAAELTISYWFLVRADLRKFLHFQEISVKFHEMTLEELVALKEAFVTSPDIKYFRLLGVNLNENQLQPVFGTPFHGLHHSGSQWFFENRNRKEHVLWIERKSEKNSLICSAMPTLLEMTAVPMTNILEKCDFKSVLTLRKVCHSLRNFIDDSSFETDVGNIEIAISPTGFLVTCNWFHGISAKDCTQNDLKIILEMARNSKSSCFTVITNPDNVGGLDDLEDILKNQTRPLQTEQFVMEGSAVLKVLPYLDSKTLKEIFIRSVNYGTDNQNLDGIEKVMELEQFKNAMKLIISHFFWCVQT
ncbi:unnamed protein product [Caenorhabditis brenneri]